VCYGGNVWNNMCIEITVIHWNVKMFWQDYGITWGHLKPIENAIYACSVTASNEYDDYKKGNP